MDVWDAVTSDRVYRKAWSREKAIAHIRSQLGNHLDPNLGDVFFEMIEKEEQDLYQNGNCSG